MAEALDERSRRVLSEVVRHYIDTGSPIGSRTISKQSGFDISPATIRNVMADLAELGLVGQSHSSSGRIPTEYGLRLYVDSFLEVEKLSSDEKEVIANKIAKKLHDVPGMLKETSKVLSNLSHHTAIVIAPKVSSARLKHIEFISLRKKILLAVMVDSTGLVQNKVLEIKDDLSQSELDRFSRYLNDLLRNLSLDEIRRRIAREMQTDTSRLDELVSRALKLSEQAFTDNEEDVVYIQGRTSFLNEPDFANIEAMRKIFTALEEKTKLINLLTKTLNAEGVQIFIGSECNLEDLEDVSIITSPYRKGYFPLGVLAVIGPTRMNYSKVIPIVDYTAKMVTNIFNNL